MGLCICMCECGWLTGKSMQTQCNSIYVFLFKNFQFVQWETSDEDIRPGQKEMCVPCDWISDTIPRKGSCVGIRYLDGGSQPQDDEPCSITGVLEIPQPGWYCVAQVGVYYQSMCLPKHFLMLN